jgi:DNA replication protein DnaC
MTQNQAPVSFLAACMATEVESRQQKQLNTRLKQARFPEVKTIENFDFGSIPKLPKTTIVSLADCKFIRKRENIICVGQSGTGNYQKFFVIERFLMNTFEDHRSPSKIFR